MSWLWKSFVCGWLLVPLVAALETRQAPPSRVALELPVLLGLAASYLWVTLRDAVGPGDLELDGPPARAVRRRLAWLGLMALLVLAQTLLAPETESWWLAQNVIVAAGLVLPLPLAVWTIAGVTGAVLMGTWYLSGSPAIASLLLLAFGASAIAVRALTVSVARLGEAREALARAAVDQERLRFARDLHDLLGHTLSLVVLKSELAGRLLPARPDIAAVEIRDVERAAREALQQVRAAVAGYRRPVLVRELAAARELLDAAAIIPVIEGPPSDLPPEVDGLLAWAVREGVTNVIRHSGAQRCEIGVRHQQGVAELLIVDDGAGGSAGGHPPGHGLSGLADRAWRQGATVRAGRRSGGGFELSVVAPMTGREAGAVS